MARGICPVCDRLVGITPSERQADGWSSRWWKVDVHADGKGGLCPGGGRRV